jgi:hypothetical protein
MLFSEMVGLPSQSEWRVKKREPRPGPPVTADLLEVGVDAVPVRIEIWQNEVLTGWDDGAFGFEPNAIWFSGRASSFHLTRNDFDAPTLHNPWDATHLGREVPEVVLWLRHPSRRICIRLTVHFVEGRHTLFDESRILNEISRICEEEDSPPESQYPPLDPRPGVIDGTATWIRPIAWSAAGLFLTVRMVLAWNDEPEVVASVLIFLLIGLLVVAVAMFSLSRHRRADQKFLRWLDHEESGS